VFCRNADQAVEGIVGPMELADPLTLDRLSLILEILLESLCIARRITLTGDTNHLDLDCSPNETRIPKRLLGKAPHFGYPLRLNAQ